MTEFPEPIFKKSLSPSQKYFILGVAAFTSLAYGIWWARRSANG